MRAWDQELEALEAANATLYVLTPDRPEPLAAAIARHDLKSPILPIDKSLWAEWGITNRSNDKLPHPSSFIIDPDGVVVYAQIFEDYRERNLPSDVVATLVSLQAGGDAPPTEDTPSEPSQGPQWDDALQLRAEAVDGGINLHLDIREGFHVYGAKEEISRPLYVTVDGRDDIQVHIPDGEQKEFALGVVHVLKDEVDLRVPVDPPASGTLDVQLCTDGACSPPFTMSWTVE